jgi:ketosteroid isomerase-like protein
MKSNLVLTALCLMLPFMAAAQEPTKIIAMENLWNRAELNNDAPAVRLLLADDFVMTVAEGTIYNKAQIVASVADKSYRPEVLQSSDLVVHSYGNTAVVTGAYYEKGIDKGKPWERRGRFTDTWMNLGGPCATMMRRLMAELMSGGTSFFSSPAPVAHTQLAYRALPSNRRFSQ